MRMGIKYVFAVTLMAALAQGCGGVEGDEAEGVGSWEEPTTTQENPQAPSTLEAPEAQAPQLSEEQDSRIVTAAGVSCHNAGGPFCGAPDVGCGLRTGLWHALYQRQLCYDSSRDFWYTADNHVGCC